MPFEQIPKTENIYSAANTVECVMRDTYHFAETEDMHRTRSACRELAQGVHDADALQRLHDSYIHDALAIYEYPHVQNSRERLDIEKGMTLAIALLYYDSREYLQCLRTLDQVITNMTIDRDSDEITTLINDAYAHILQQHLLAQKALQYNASFL